MTNVDTRAFLDEVCRLLEAGETNVPVPVAGGSMCPFLCPGDTAYLSAPDTPVKTGDVVLFQRPTGAYILHRVVGEAPDGQLWLLGDAQLIREPVSRAWIRGRVVRIRRKGKLSGPESWRWRGFQWIWLRLIPLRGWIFRLRNRIRH